MMKASLKDKVAVVTGAGGGIGQAVVRALAEEGVKVALCGGNNIENLTVCADAAKACGAEDLHAPPGT